MTVRILVGDVRERLGEIPDESVNCVVTSPPYYGLRDYGIDGQIGLEPTLDEYLESMVEVFRELRRVLRNDGTCWINLGDSFYSGGNGASRSRLVQHEQPCDTDGKEQRGFLDPDSSCLHLCDGCRDALSSRTSDIGRPHPESASPSLQTSRDTVRLDSASTFPADAPPSALVSTTPESEPPLLAGCLHCDNCGACLTVLRSSSRDARLCARRASYKFGKGSPPPTSFGHIQDRHSFVSAQSHPPIVQPHCTTLKPKDLMMVPARLALALQADGWWLRSDIIWQKPNPMPESVRDRPTNAHEHIFLLTKSARYWYDADAVKTEGVGEITGGPRANPDRRESRGVEGSRTDKQRGHSRRHAGFNDRWDAMSRDEQMANGANLRNVWSIPTVGFPGAHFATFPPEIPRRCIKAGCPADGTVLDPFGGAGTTGLVADELGRDAILIELNPKYAAMAQERIRSASPMFAEVATA